jgi:hypothetical protein
MSLLNIITDKSTESALVSSRPLSRFTSTTFAEAGTSLDKVVSDVHASAKNAVESTNITTSSLYAPIYNMRDAAIASDPSSAPTYNRFTDLAIGKIDSSASSVLSGTSNSLVDIQKAGKNALSVGASEFSSNVQTFNPRISNSITNVATSGIESAGRAIDTVSSSAFGAASKQISSTVSGINTAIANKASAAIKGLTSAAAGIKGLPGIGGLASTTSSSSSASTSTVGFTSIASVDSPVDSKLNSTDLIYQEYKVYIEGVQIPFMAISISQPMGQLPRATIQIPPQAGLMDIARFYEPKIHIFYTDKNTGGDRLLFWGHIVAVNYAYSKQDATAMIMFECEHKNSLMEQLTFEWSAGGAGHATEGTNLTDSNPDQTTVQLHNFNSDLTMILALQGITGLRTDDKDKISPDNKTVIQADPTKLDPRFKEFEKRFIGMPSSIMNLWNQAKKEIFANQKLNLIFMKMYLPLIEDGIAFFDRMSGHYFVENQINGSRQQHCNDHDRPEASKYDTLLPPAFRMDIMSAAHTQLVLNALNSQLGFSNEQMNFYQLFYNFFYTIEYDMVTLASPAEVPVDPTVNVDLDDPKTWRAQKRMAVETVVKPQMPFYYAPLCNVILPNMFTGIQVSQAENVIPTRVTVMNTALSSVSNSPTSIGVNYRAPHSIREAVAIGKQLLGGSGNSVGNLLDTTSSSYNVPGKYELGRGIRHKKLMMPVWLSYFSSGSNAKRSANDDQVSPVEGTKEAENLAILKKAWVDRYGYSDQSTTGEDTGSATRAKYKDVLNPYSEDSKIMAHERMLFAAADFDFTKEVVQSKTGNVECIFNPYIIPGYPMDILDRSPNNPSFHALCASVTHTITPSMASTSVSFVAAVTYAELSNYFLPPTHPWLQTALQLINVTPDGNTGDSSKVYQTLLGNENAVTAADQFYRSVLGVGAAYPNLIYNFEEGVPYALARSSGKWREGAVDRKPLPNGGEGNDNYTGVGNLRLVSRQIESRKSIEDKFGLKFIDMSPGNYNGAPAGYVNQVLTNRTLLEPGASLFLDYEEITDFINKSKR